MEYRKIGNLRVSLIGLGANQIGSSCDARASTAIVHRALELGVTFFDTAEEYGNGQSEIDLGKGLGGRRDTVVIATKFGCLEGRAVTGSGRAPAIRRALEGSLTRLGTDYVDLYQMHFPDPATPLEETLETLNALVDEGKVREIGACNFSAEQVEEAAALCATHGWRPFASVQNRLNLLRREALNDVIPTCERLGIAFIPFFPLAAGVLTGKYRKGLPPPEDSRLGGRFVSPEQAQRILKTDVLDKVERLEALAASHGHGVADLALAWLAVQPAVATIIAGATRVGQVEANVAASMWRISPEVAAAALAIVA